MTGNVVSLVGEGGDEVDEDAEAIDLNKIPKRIILSHADFVCKLRMLYARCYYTVQGKTYRDTHVVLLDTSHKHFDMRKRIHQGHQGGHPSWPGHDAAKPSRRSGSHSKATNTHAFVHGPKKRARS